MGASAIAFWNIVSIRRVTAKPPKTLIEAIRIAANAMIVTDSFPDPICSRAPTMMIPEIALVSAISGGVCREWDTLEIT